MKKSDAPRAQRGASRQLKLISHSVPIHPRLQGRPSSTHTGKPHSAAKKKRDAVFHPEFREDLSYWVRVDRSVAVRAFDLIEAIMREPFTGIGKPEPLKYLATGTWSRRLTQEHRIVYMVREDRIDFLQARYHY